MKKYYIFLFAIIMVTGIAGIAQAGTAELSGWSQNTGPWSSTIGWVSFNSKDSNTGTGGVGQSSVSYNVYVSTTTGSTYGTFGGQAWSSNIGWISFDAGLVSPCGSQGRLNLLTGAIDGWARVLSGSSDAGADGCISLSGNASNGGTYGVSMSPTTGVFTGFSWGSVNVGWLNFAGLVCPNCRTDTTVPVPQPLTLSCSVTPNPANSGETVTFSANTTDGTAPYHWSVTNGTLTSSANSASSVITNYIPAAIAPTFTVTDANSRTGTISCNAPNFNTIAGAYTVIISFAGTGQGSVTRSSQTCTSPDACTGTIPVGSSITLTSSPNSGSTFAGWSAGCTGTGPCTVGATATDDSVINVVATFNTNAIVNPPAGSNDAHLWFASRARPTDDLMSSQLPLTIPSNIDVPIRFDWGGTIAGCSGGELSGPNMTGTNWLLPLTMGTQIDTVSVHPYGTVTLSQLSVGTYVLKLNCHIDTTTSINGVDVPIVTPIESVNTIRLIVIRSIINED